MTQIGTVIATSESPSLESIVLILEKNSKSLVERGQFISISKNNSTIILGIVLGIKIYNAYYETIDASIHEIASNNYEAIFPIDEWESTRAEIKPLGEIEIKTGRIREKAYISPPSIVSNFLGLDDNGIYLGKLHSNNVEIRVNLSRLLRKHLAILAISGAGKSYAASILIEEVYKHSKLGVICVDPHGEYSSVLPSIAKKEDIEVIRGSFITIGVPELNAWEISEFMPDISVVQTRELDKIISRLKRNKQTFFGLQDVIQKIEESETINPRTKDALIGWLDSLNRTYLFSAKTSPNPLE
ncbi:MAG: ATP-binding protein [Candidatus Hodarchaeales archaeon]